MAPITETDGTCIITHKSPKLNVSHGGNSGDLECQCLPAVLFSNNTDISKSPKSNSVVVLQPLMSSSGSDERDGGNNGTQGNQESGQSNQGSSSGSSGREEKRNKPPGISRTSLTYNEEDMRLESKRIKTFGKSWPHPFLPPKDLAEAGFYFIKADLVRCAFCKIEVGRWEEGDIPRKEHKRWSGNCPFMRGVPCGNVPLSGSDAGSSSSDSDVYSEDFSVAYDTCGIHEEMRPFSFCDNEAPRASANNSSVACVKSKFVGSDNGGAEGELPKSSLEKLGVRDIRAPAHPEYCAEAARLATYNLWPLAIQQRPKDLSEAGFYYTGNGDQTICFHCGGGLRDWEEGDDPWVEHAKWFSRCYFLNLVKGSDFVSQVTETRPALITAEEVRGLVNPCPTTAGQDIASSANAAASEYGNSPMSAKSTSVETAERKSEDTKEIKDEGRLCKICYSAELGVVFLPCGHMVACIRCAPSLSDCPVCRQPFTHTVRAFLS